MLMFNMEDFLNVAKQWYLNTSHVNVQSKRKYFVEGELKNLNTSHVNVQWSIAESMSLY